MIEFRRFSLPNGLRVIHHYDPSTVMVAVDVLYDTGARDEDRRLTGIAHLFEHLMFGGSANIADFDKELESAGGTSNAWTSTDFTNFFDIVPAHNVETVFHLESDRMLGLSFSTQSLEVQRSVVIEEFKQQCLNRPYGDLMHGLRAAAYAETHPYSWPVIGIEPEHIAKVSIEDVKNWFYAHYAPNNAVLAIAGNLSYEDGKRLVEKWFGDIPAREITPRQYPEPGFPTGNVTVEMSGNVPNTLALVAIPMDGYGTHDYRAADCITDILSAGRSSRFIQNLVIPAKDGIIEADASVIGSEGPGLLMMQARLADGASAEKAVANMREQLEMLSHKENVTQYELHRTFNRFESTFLIGNLDSLQIAQNLAMAEMHSEDINLTVERQRKVTADDIARVASELIHRPYVTLIYKKSEDMDSSSLDSVRNRMLGVIYGHAIGNALGLPAEFLTKKEVQDRFPGGLTRYKDDKGIWEDDDTLQMLCLVDDIVENGHINPATLAKKLLRWLETDGRGCGNLVYSVLTHRDFLNDPFRAAADRWELSGRENAPNGALMRTSAVGLLRDDVEKNTVEACRVTHADPRCIGSCVIITEIINNLVWHNRELTADEIKCIGEKYDSRIAEWVDMAENGTLEDLDLDMPHAIGYTLRSLGAALWAYFHSPDFITALAAISEEGGDADTNAAIAGAVLGAKFGFSGIPPYYIANIENPAPVRDKADALINKILS